MLNDFMRISKAARKPSSPERIIQEQEATIKDLNKKVKQLEDELFDKIVLGSPPKKK